MREVSYLPKITNWEKIPTDNGKMWENSSTGAIVQETVGNRGTGRTVWLEFNNGRKFALDINKEERWIRGDIIRIELKEGTQKIDEIVAPAKPNGSPSEIGYETALDYMKRHPEGDCETDIRQIVRSVAW
jgi:hypothetical protein